MRRMGIDAWKTAWSVALAGACAGAVVLVFTGDDAGSRAVAAETQAGAESGPSEAAKNEAGKGEAVPPGHAEQGSEGPGSASNVTIARTADGCLADASTLEDLKRQKGEFEARKRELDAREAELKAREQALGEQIKQLSATRDEMAKIEQVRRAEGETKIAKLVETVESMNPKASAALLSGLDEALATATMARLSTAKLAKVMNVMDPARSTRLSELLAGVARAKTRSAAPAAAVATSDRQPASSQQQSVATTAKAEAPSKGGDTNDGKSHEQQSSSRNTASESKPRR